MTTNVIKQVVGGGEGGSQTIKIAVRSNERGPEGKQGEKGEAATIEAGHAYTVPASYGPSVMNVGTSSNAIFDFYIPTSEGGEVGPAGPPGPAGKDGAIQYAEGSGIEISNGKISLSTSDSDFFTRYLGEKCTRWFIDEMAELHAIRNKHDTDAPLSGKFDYCYFLGNLRQNSEGPLRPSPTNPQSPIFVSGTQKFVIAPEVGYDDEILDRPIRQVYEIPLGALELYGFAAPYSISSASGYNSASLQDKIKKRDGQSGWWLERKVKKVSFDGSIDEGWQQDGYAFYVPAEVKQQNYANKVSPVMCDYFYSDVEESSLDPSDEQYRGCCWCDFNNEDTRIYFMPLDPSQNTVAAFETWLSTHEITVYYLTTEENYEYTQITDTSLVSAMDNLQNAYNYSTTGCEMQVIPPSASYSSGGIEFQISVASLPNLAYMVADTQHAVASVQQAVDNLENGDSYSTSETNTNTKWIDDKDIYKRTIVWSAPGGSDSYVNVPFNYNIIDTVVKTEGFLSSGAALYPIPGGWIPSGSLPGGFSSGESITSWGFLSGSGDTPYLNISANAVDTEKSDASIGACDGRFTIYYTKKSS